IEAVRVGREDAPIVGARRIFLNVVEAVGAGLPHRDGGVGKRLAADIGDATVEDTFGPGLDMFRDLGARGELWRGLTVERAEQAGVGSLLQGSLVMQAVDKG